MTLGILLHFNMIAYISETPAAVLDLSLFAAMMFAGYLLFVAQLPNFLVRPVSGLSRRIKMPGLRATRP